MHLSWVRAPSAIECGDAGRVQADVVRRLGKNPFSEPSRYFIEATVSAQATSFQAELEMRDESGASLGSRKVVSDAATCASLVSAAELAIALMIDPDAAILRRLPPAPIEPKKAESKPLEVAPVAPSPPPRLNRAAWFVALVAASRVLPQAAMGARVGGEVRLLRRLDFEASLTLLPEMRQTLSGFDTGFGLTYGTGGLCFRLLDHEDVTLAGCGFGSVGAMHAVAYEPARGRQGQLLWSATGVGLRAAWVLARPLALRAGVEGSVPLERRDYVVSRARGAEAVVFRDPAVSATLHLGLSVRF